MRVTPFHLFAFPKWVFDGRPLARSQLPPPGGESRARRQSGETELVPLLIRHRTGDR